MALKKKTTFTQLRNNAKKYFDAVERGESIQVYRHGKLAAIIVPADEDTLSRWSLATPLRLKNVSLSRAILDDRDGSN